jgi:YHS domain-containing protein
MSRRAWRLEENMANRFDPVCGVELTYMNTSGRTEYLGEMYQFCSLRCRDLFEKAPGRWAAALRHRERHYD